MRKVHHTPVSPNQGKEVSAKSEEKKRRKGGRERKSKNEAYSGGGETMYSDEEKNDVTR